MTTMTNRTTQAQQATGTKVAATCGAIGGSAVVGCCSIGILGGAFTGVGAGSTFFALDTATPVGDRPFLMLAGLVVAVVATWLYMRRRVVGLPEPVARGVVRRSLGIALFSGVAAYFVVMQIVIPLLFLGGVLEMGAFFPG